MRILTGALRGQTIFFKANPYLRPTADKTRKAIFDMLRGNVEDTRALDLFSGTGALGIEALSSGAESVTFVEMERPQALAIKSNLEKLGLSDKSEVVALEAVKALEKFYSQGRTFDLVFMDPPYEKGMGQKALTAISKFEIVKKGALIVLECRDSEDPPNIEKDFLCVKNKIYGDTRVLVYQRSSPAS